MRAAIRTIAAIMAAARAAATAATAASPPSVVPLLLSGDCAHATMFHIGGGGRITKAVGITAAHSDLPSGKYMGCGWRKWQDEVDAAHSPSSRAALFLGIRR